jgi:hypothetical protein
VYDILIRVNCYEGSHCTELIASASLNTSANTMMYSHTRNLHNEYLFSHGPISYTEQTSYIADKRDEESENCLYEVSKTNS